MCLNFWQNLQFTPDDKCRVAILRVFYVNFVAKINLRTILDLHMVTYVEHAIRKFGKPLKYTLLNYAYTAKELFRLNLNMKKGVS